MANNAAIKVDMGTAVTNPSEPTSVRTISSSTKATLISQHKTANPCITCSLGLFYYGQSYEVILEVDYVYVLCSGSGSGSDGNFIG